MRAIYARALPSTLYFTQKSVVLWYPPLRYPSKKTLTILIIHKFLLGDMVAINTTTINTTIITWYIESIGLEEEDQFLTLFE